MTPEERTEMSGYLNKEDRKKLHDEFQVSRETIRRWLLPDDTAATEEFLLRAMELATARRTKREAISKRLKKLAA